MLHFSLTKKLAIAAVLLAGLYYALPNMLSTSVRDIFSGYIHTETVNLGLDLQGGSHMVLQVDLPVVEKRAYENLEDTIKRILRDVDGDRVAYRLLQIESDSVTFSLVDTIQSLRVKERLMEEVRGIEVFEKEGAFIVQFSKAHREQMKQDALEQTLEILRMRVDEFGVAEPAIQRQGDDRVIIELPGIDDVARAKDIIGRTAQLSFHLVDDRRDATTYQRRRAPIGYMLAYEEHVDHLGQVVKTPYILKKRASLTGQNLSGASSGFTENGEAAVFINFDSKGTRQFADLTTRHVGERMAIVLDGKVYSAPVLREPILGGTASITGNFKPKEAQDLAMILRSGALPAPVMFAQERTVGPSLGQDSIDAGKNAIVVGFVMVLIFMLMFYRGFGLAANVALLFNVVLILGFMTMIGATMTLPGMAGIVLTIGMAVDANVLIFERIKEEYRQSKSPRKAMERGFSSAYGTILDANITTLIAAIVLFAMGSGPIKGFALTLSVGIASSMFTAIMITRLLLATWLHKAKPKTLKGL